MTLLKKKSEEILARSAYKKTSKDKSIQLQIKYIKMLQNSNKKDKIKDCKFNLKISS